ncbi:phosphotransferase [Amycolatopsis kentuckyensis]|uniref:phosphotransferase n=1 Tax=Amycolatopsis kentuckyensis TaxID=218823 RepID=UPI0013023039|nr:phosphotransferase [Amycolatopsis kentuckyensis]
MHDKSQEPPRGTHRVWRCTEPVIAGCASIRMPVGWHDWSDPASPQDREAEQAAMREPAEQLPLVCQYGDYSTRNWLWDTENDQQGVIGFAMAHHGTTVEEFVWLCGAGWAIRIGREASPKRPDARRTYPVTALAHGPVDDVDRPQRKKPLVLEAELVVVLEDQLDQLPAVRGTPVRSHSTGRRLAWREAPAWKW